MTRTALLNGTVFTATADEPLVGVSLVIEDGQIKDLRSTSSPPPEADVVLDCQGKWVLPGLIDAHVHVGAVDHNSRGQHARYASSYLAFRMAERLRIMLQTGYTTVRDASGTDVGFKMAVQDGLVEGPRLIVSIRAISQTGGHGDSRTRFERDSPGEHGEFGMTHVVADGPDEVRKVVRETLRRGADVIKIMASGGAVSPTGRIDSRQYSVAELAAAVEEADAAGTYVMAHALSSGAIRNCLDAGIRCIEHGNFLDAETAKLMAEADASLVPTLLAYEYDAEHGERYGYSKEVQEKLRIGADRGREGLRRAVGAGVRVGCGSDMIGDLVGIMGREIALQAEVMGVVPALISVTRINAEILGIADQVGTLEPGKVADVIVVDGDPSSDPGVLEGPANINTVIKAGRIVRTALD